MRFFNMLIPTTCALALVVDPTLGLSIDSSKIRRQPVLSSAVSSSRLSASFDWLRQQSAFLSSVSDSTSQGSDFESWLSLQSARSFDGILANIGPDGANVVGQNVQPGVVVASPSHDHPDYFYHWVRDGAITIRVLVDEYAKSGSASVKTIIDAYVDNVRTTQWTPNPSGQFGRGGLGEPKFEVDGRAFVGTWGRPQRDGPALRAITLISYTRALQDRGASIDSLRYLYDLIKPDLEYVSKFWASPGFDLWEEQEGLHFFTAMVQYKALFLGKDISLDFNDDGAARWYRTQSNGLKQFLLSFWDEERGYLVETLASPRSGLDTAILLGAIHGGSETVFPIYSDSMIATLQALVADMLARYPINEQDSFDSDSFPSAVGIGRYPEDVYSGGDLGDSGLGNPWFLCTASVAHTLYGLVEHLALSNSGLTITNLTADFYLPLLSPTPEIKPEYCDFSATGMWSRSAPILRFAPGSRENEQVITNIMHYADGFLRVVRKHADGDGNMSEQFDRNTGFMRGARQLTWSFESVFSAIEMRERAVSAIAKRRAYLDRFGI
ncbi:Six-hairpin glycosidase-like protein [Lipomyces kononenkoae]|uniref:Six-hairpin glycosidase-like protein n=1 Tax=Lipomyces kononenkoae TaxID=34357 RepID=A0ACC3SYJ7_LIPKO